MTRIACHLRVPYGNDTNTKAGKRANPVYGHHPSTEGKSRDSPRGQDLCPSSRSGHMGQASRDAARRPPALIQAQDGTQTPARVIRWYIDTFESVSKWQRTKQTHLEFLERHQIGKSNPFALTTAILVDHARRRRAEGRVLPQLRTTSLG